MVKVPLVQPELPVAKLNVPFAIVPRYASAPVPIMVPLLEPEVNITETVKLDMDCDCATACPAIVKLLCAEITGKHEGDGLLTAVTVPVMLLPFWVRFTVSVVGDAAPWPVGVNVILHAPLTTGANVVLPGMEE